MEKHLDMEGEGKGDGHQRGRKPRIPEPVLKSGYSPSEEVSENWTPKGAELMEQWTNGWMCNCAL